MARKQRVKQSTGNIFDHFANVGILEKEEKQEVTPEVAALQARIEEQGRLLASLQQGNANRDLPMVASNSGGGPQVPPVDPSKVTVSLDGLPNRDEDPDGFFREYTLRMNAAMQAQTHAVTQKLTEQFERERNADRLWNGFKEFAPKWAPYTSLVETVSNRVAADLQAKGVDLQRLLAGQPDRFYQEVEAALKQQYGKLVDDAPATGGEGGDDDDDAPLDPMDPALIQGVGGPGSGQASRGPVNGKSPEARAPDMLDDLRAIQRRMGVI